MASRPKTGGRRKGTPNRRTQKLEAAFKAMTYEIGKAIPNAFEGDAVALLIAVYKDPALPLDVRIDAASKAARYERPMLQAIEHSGNVDKPIQQVTRIERVIIRPEDQDG